MRERKSVAARLFVFYVILTFLSVPLTGFAAADGGVFVKIDTVSYVPEDSQFGVIDYRNGIEKLFISVGFPWQESEKMAWIFPIPSDPDRVQADIVDGYISFSGTDIVEEAREAISDSAEDFCVSYALSVAMPWFLPMIMMDMTTGLVGGTTLGGSREFGGGNGNGVTVHSHSEAGGLVLELISATAGEGVYTYLADKGLDLAEGTVPQFDHYVREDFSFIVTWVEDSGLTLHQPGVLVRFPTERMYYPLKLTSVYGDHVVPMNVIVVDHVWPQVYWDIMSYTRVRFHDGSVYGGRDTHELWTPEGARMSEFVASIRDSWDWEFTAIEIEAPSRVLSQDLWIDVGVPPKLAYAQAVGPLFGEVRILFFLLVFLVLSPFVGMAAGALVFGRGKEHMGRSATFGLWNLLGILGLLIWAFFPAISNPYSAKQRLSFVVVFSIVFLAVILTLMIAAYVPLL